MTVPRPSKIVVFSNMLTPYTNELYNRLIDRGVDLEVLSCTESEKNRAWAKSFEPKYATRILPGYSIQLSSSRFAHFNLGVSKALREMAPDVLVISGFYPSMAAATLWARRHGTRLLLTCDGWKHTMPNSPYHALVRPWIIGSCDGIICCGTKGVEYFEDQGVPPQRITVVPLNPAWPPPSEVAPFEQREFDLLWVGHFTGDVKNVGFFAEVCRKLAGRLPALRVRLVGQGPMEDEVLAGLAEHGIDYVHSRNLHWQEMAKVYQSSKLLLFPSLWEAWGLVCNEAHMCGTPCIASPFSGASGDLVVDGRSGRVLDLDVDLWAGAALEILSDPALWNRLSAGAREQVADRSIERSSLAFERALGRVLEGSANASLAQAR